MTSNVDIVEDYEAATATAAAANNNAVTVQENSASNNTNSALGVIGAVKIPGNFEMTTQTGFDYSSTQLGTVRNLELGLLETARNTGSFVQLSTVAYLQITCDFRKFITFNATDTDVNEDDAYQLTGFTVSYDRDGAAAQADLRATSSQYWLNIAPAINNASDNAADANSSATLQFPFATAAVAASTSTNNDTVISHWFPVGAVIIDLSGALTNAVNSASLANDVNIGTGDSTTDNATYQVKVDKTAVGMTLYGQITITNGSQGSPTLSMNTAFDPSTVNTAVNSTVLGSVQHSAITITLLNQDDYTKAQKIVLTDASGNVTITSSAAALNADSPSAADVDDFSLTLSLEDLAGTTDNANSIGTVMGNAIRGTVPSHLLTSFNVTANGISFDNESEFSGYLRTLAAARHSDDTNATAADNSAARLAIAAMPILPGEKLIISESAKVNLPITPFVYEFEGRKSDGQGGTMSAPSDDVIPFNLIDDMEVFAVLKHDPTSTTPLIGVGGPLTVPE